MGARVVATERGLAGGAGADGAGTEAGTWVRIMLWFWIYALLGIEEK